MARITAGELRNFHYFHFEKGDVHRWVDWPETRQRLAKDDDELLELFREVENAQRQLNHANRDLQDVLRDRIENAEDDEPETP